jgi:hypothetical protein
MSFFEYIMVIGAILLGLGFAQLMIGASAIARERDWDLVHGVWLVALVVTHLQFWWSFWDLEGLPPEAWNAGRFVYFVAGPGILFFLTNVLVPNPTPENVNWRDHFERGRVPFMVMVALLVAWTSGLGIVIQGQPFLHPTRVTHGLVLAICGLGLLAPGRRAQAVAAVSFLVVVTGNWVLLRWTPGALLGG